MNDEAVREKLADALVEWWPAWTWSERYDILDALLPVVREIAVRAWDEGFDRGYLHVPGHETPNPHRADALTKPPDGPVR